MPDRKNHIIQFDCTIFYTEHIWYRAPVTPRVILSEAAPPAKNHARPPIIAAQSNPAPSGAPAGGISTVEWYHLTLANPRKSLPPGGEGGAPAPDEGETGERTT